MKQFEIKSGGKSYLCDTDGKVSESANVIGKWTTTDANKIRITRTNESVVDVPVEWSFSPSNQLTIRQGGNVVFTLATDANALPSYRLARNVLLVDPDGDSDFEFPLQCRFGLDDKGNLEVSVNGVVSTLDGFIEDTKSRFRFRFYDKALANFPSSLVFSGQWEQIKKGPDGKDLPEIRLHFKLDDPALEDTTAPLHLPAKLTVDPKRNHLVLVYQSQSYGEQRLEFLGTVEISPNWTVSFRIADSRDASSGVRASKIQVATTFEWEHVAGTLTLYVGRERGPGSQAITVGGNLQAKFKKGTLDWSFAYQNSTAGTKSTMAFATSLAFVYKDSAIWVEYTQAGKTSQVNVTGRLVEENFVLSGGVEIKNDPGGRRIGAFVGVSW